MSIGTNHISSNKVGVIGSGFSGLSAACYLSAAGFDVHVFEKNSEPGGRARRLITPDGFVFDMGPSWYWMPDVFEKFFNDFGFRVDDFYKLHSLNPAFDIVFDNDQKFHIPNDFGELCTLFERIEKGSGNRLVRFMKEAELKYKIGIENLVYKPGLSLFEFADMNIIRNAFRLQVFSSYSVHLRRYFKDYRLLALMEFPVLFLGARPQDTPALYSLMNYAGLKLGTWYPQGGFGKVIDAFVKIAKHNGVTFHFNSPVERIQSSSGAVRSIISNGNEIDLDGVVASADYHHVESRMLSADERNYQDDYWKGKTFAPSSLIYYLGISRKVSNLNHHTLFFEEEFSQHARDIYTEPRWPGKPLFYACCPSRTDNSVAPGNHENLFLLMPIAPGLSDSEEIRETYYRQMMSRIERITGESISPYVLYKKSYCVSDFITDYNSYKGNAYGLANTLMQTAIFKPKIKNHKIRNLFYAGQLTVPGPGVPPSIISGKIAAGLLTDSLRKKQQHESVI